MATTSRNIDNALNSAHARVRAWKQKRMQRFYQPQIETATIAMIVGQLMQGPAPQQPTHPAGGPNAQTIPSLR